MGINWTLRASILAPGSEVDTTGAQSTEDLVLNFGKLFLGGKTLHAAALTPPMVQALFELFGCRF